MSQEEVNVEAESDDYEVVPIGPIRKLERRIDSIEEEAGGGSANEEVIRDVLDIMKSNQKIVNDMTESTHQLKNSVEDLTHKMDEVVDNMNSFMDLLKDASEVDMEGEIIGDMQGKIADAIGNRMDQTMKDMQNSNQEIVNALRDLEQTMKRSQQDQGLVDRKRKRQQAQPEEEPQQQSDQRRVNRNNQGRGNDQRMRKLRNKFQENEQ